MRVLLLFMFMTIAVYGNGLIIGAGRLLLNQPAKSIAKRLLWGTTKRTAVMQAIEAGVISDKDFTKALGLIRGRVKATDDEIEDCMLDMYTNPIYRQYRCWTNYFDRNVHTCIHAFNVKERKLYLERVKTTLRIVKAKKSFKNWWAESRGRVLLWRDGFMIVVTNTRKVVSAYRKKTHNKFHQGTTPQGNKIRRKLWKK